MSTIFIQIASLVLASLLLEGVIASEDIPGDLLQVHFLFRHTDRTPVSTYANDPYKDYDWVEGKGALTAKVSGLLVKNVSSLYSTDGQLQNQLANLLPKNVHAYSSPVRRVIDSSLCLLSGLIPPTPTQIWSNNTALAQYWQPIAIAMSSPEKAYALGEEAPCPVRNDIWSTMDQLPSVKELFVKHERLLANLTVLTGENFTKLADPVSLYDTLFTEQNCDLQLPTWADDATMAKLKEFRELGFAIAGQFPDPFLRLRVGPILAEILGNLQKRGEPEEGRMVQADEEERQGKRLFLYGTHDFTLSTALTALGFIMGASTSPPEQPTYGSGLLIELRTGPNSNPSPLISFAYASANLTDDSISITALPLNTSALFARHCANSFCRLDYFASALVPLLPVNIEVECGLVGEGGGGNGSETTVTPAVQLVTMACLFGLLFVVHERP